jgi:hypothetical protein
MKRLVMACMALLLALGIHAQENDGESGYRNALGIRLGPSAPAVKSGITYKHFLGNGKALEGILSFGDGFGICGLYEIHKPLATENLQWFIGFGGYAGVSNKITNVGAAGIVGLDYRFPNLPLNLSLDWKPELNLVQKLGFEGSTVGLSVRYVFR